MATNKPTYSELKDEISGVDMRVVTLERWRTKEEAFKAALLQVRKEEKETKLEAKKMEIYKQVLVVLGLLVTILTAIAATRSLQ